MDGLPHGGQGAPSGGPDADVLALQRRHPDGDRWLDVGHFGTREIAKLALDAFVVHGQGEKGDFRVKKVATSQKPA